MANTKILNLDEILADESKRTIVWQGQEYEIAGVTGEAYLRFLSKQAQINKAMESGDLDVQYRTSLELIKLLAPDMPVDEMQKLPWPVFQKVINFVVAAFQEEAGETTGGGQTAGGEDDASLGESTSP